MTPLAVDTNLGDFTAQSWPQLAALGSALVLCSLIGLEREIRQKSAGLRTHTLVGLGAALFMVISKYGFGDVLDPETVILDPSRVAAQIVSGVGFIGGGLIFVRRNAVLGLTTAAVVWVSAAVGTACGAGLWLLGAFVTAAHFFVVYAYPPIINWVSRATPTSSRMHVSYRDDSATLREILATATQRGFTVHEVRTERRSVAGGWPEAAGAEAATVDLALRLVGRGDITDLATEIAENRSVLGVHVGQDDDSNE